MNEQLLEEIKVLQRSILASAVLREARKLAETRPKLPIGRDAPYEGRPIQQRDIQVAVESLRDVLGELQKKNL